MNYQSMKTLQTEKAQFVTDVTALGLLDQELFVKLLLESDLPLTKAPQIARQSN